MVDPVKTAKTSYNAGKEIAEKHAGKPFIAVMLLALLKGLWIGFQAALPIFIRIIRQIR